MADRSLESARASDAELANDTEHSKRAPGKRRWFLFATVVALFAGAVGYQAYEIHELSEEVARLTTLTNVASSDADVHARVAQGAPFAGFEPDLDRWDPRAELRRMQRELNRMFGVSSPTFHTNPRLTPPFEPGPFGPSVDVEETENEYLVSLDVPGLSETTLDVEIENNVLHVRGETNREVEDDGSAGQIVRKERFEGRFERAIPLSKTVDAAKMKSAYENGVLTLTIPKKAESNDSPEKGDAAS